MPERIEIPERELHRIKERVEAGRRSLAAEARARSCGVETLRKKLRQVGMRRMCPPSPLDGMIELDNDKAREIDAAVEADRRMVAERGRRRELRQLADGAVKCETCGNVRPPWRVIDGECVGCRSW